MKHRPSGSVCVLRPPIEITRNKQTFRFREGFRAPLGVRKSPRTEPAGGKR